MYKIKELIIELQRRRYWLTLRGFERRNYYEKYRYSNRCSSLEAYLATVRFFGLKDGLVKNSTYFWNYYDETEEELDEAEYIKLYFIEYKKWRETENRPSIYKGCSSYDRAVEFATSLINRYKKRVGLRRYILPKFRPEVMEHLIKKKDFEEYQVNKGCKGEGLYVWIIEDQFANDKASLVRKIFYRQEEAEVAFLKLKLQENVKLYCIDVYVESEDRYLDK